MIKVMDAAGEASRIVSEFGRGRGHSSGADGGFMKLMEQALERVNDEQLEARELGKQLVTGEAENLHDVMIASEKAKLSMQLTLEVRNKILSAYKEIMRMPI